MQQFDIVIVGGGLVGSAFALDLAQQNHKFSIAILEHKRYNAPDLDKLDNKIYAVSPENIRYLQSLGVWSDDDRVGTIKCMNVSGDQDGNIIFDNKTAKQLYLAKTIEYNNLQHQLYTKLNSIANIRFIYDELSDINYLEDGVILNGKNEKYKTRLLVGADGANSFVRKKINPEIEQVNYPEYGVVANFRTEIPHYNTAYQWFSKDGVLAYLPLPGNQISIVWASDKYKYLTELSNEEFAQKVTSAGKGKLGKLEVVTPAVAFPLRLFLINKTYARHMVLIGDAAHTIHPLAGQGVNLGFADAQVLAGILAKCNSYQLGDEAVLAEYNAKRIAEVRKMQLTCHALYRLFGINNPLIRQVRNLGLNLVDGLPFIKKYLIRQAITY